MSPDPPNDRPTRSGTRRRELAVSALVVACLGLQVVAGFRLLCLPEGFGGSGVRVACVPRLWPFLDYSMFHEARYPGDRLSRVVAVLSLGDWREFRLEPYDSSHEPPPRELIACLWSGDREGARAWTERWSRAHGFFVASVRIEETTLVLTRDGVVDADTVVTHRLDAFSGREGGEGE